MQWIKNLHLLIDKLSAVHWPVPFQSVLCKCSEETTISAIEGPCIVLAFRLLSTGFVIGQGIG